MKIKTKFVVITILFAVISFALSRVLWPDVPGAIAPTATQLPFFIFLSALESLAFGIGIAFLALGWKYMKILVSNGRKGSIWSFFATAWLLVSWWPHDNLHRINGENTAGLLRIEYTFHFTLILAAFILAFNFWKFMSRQVAK